MSKPLIIRSTNQNDFLAKYPWLTEELFKIDGRFKIIKTPIGKKYIQ